MGSIICLQQDSDMQYFDLDISPILQRAQDRGDVQHTRYRINDFDAFDLRMKLPGAAATVAKEISQGRKAYIHCTAGRLELRAATARRHGKAFKHPSHKKALHAKLRYTS